MKTEPGSLVDGIEAHNRQMADAISSDEIYVKLEVGYGYTVGLSSQGLPELVMFGDDPEQNRSQLFDLYYAVEHQVLDLKERPIEGLFLADGAAFKWISEEKKERIFYGCRTFYGSWQFNALIVAA